MIVRKINNNDLNRWLEMRMELWEDCPKDKHLEEMNNILKDIENNPVYVVENEYKRLIGFIEVSIHDFAPGCHTSPIGYIEGWYVVPEHRNKGIGRRLISEVEKWTKNKGFKEVGSDAEIDNIVSITAHQNMGYKIIGKDTEEVKFIKEIDIYEITCNRLIKNVFYKSRQCAYAVIFNDKNEIALVKLTKGHYMPGGGMEELENYKECIERELLEEIGYSCNVFDLICKSKEYFYYPHTHDFRVSEGYFYNVKLGEVVTFPSETDHKLVWLKIDDAIENIIPVFQKEALKYIKKQIVVKQCV